MTNGRVDPEVAAITMDIRALIEQSRSLLNEIDRAVVALDIHQDRLNQDIGREPV